MTAGKGVGQIAFEAYAESCNHLSVRDEPLPTWDEMPERIKTHWTAAGLAVAQEADRHIRAVYRIPDGM